MANFAAWVSSNPLQVSPLILGPSSSYNSPTPPHNLSIPFLPYPFLCISNKSYVSHAKYRNSHLEPVSKPPIIQEFEQEEENALMDEFEHETLTDGDDFTEGEYDLEEETEPRIGDGAGGGGMSLAGTSWDKKALSLAEDTLLQFNGDLKIYAFKTLTNSVIQVRIEKLSNRSGSPSMADIHEFSSAYRAQLDEAEKAEAIPENIYLEVSSPGVERVVQIPQELDRFKDRPMHVKYVTEAMETGLSTENDGVFRLISFDLESSCCTWALADVKINRNKAGKGRPMNKKQREWRLNTPFQSLRLVRLYSDI